MSIFCLLWNQQNYNLKSYAFKKVPTTPEKSTPPREGWWSLTQLPLISCLLNTNYLPPEPVNLNVTKTYSMDTLSWPIHRIYLVKSMH